MNMKKAGMKMSVAMGLTMSLVLSLVGNLSSGSFTLAGYLKSFAVSFLISMVLGIFVPIRKISAVLLKKYDLKPGTLKAGLLEALVSALGYSPLMTFVMVFLAYSQAKAHGASIPFLPMLLRSECISILVAFLLSFVITPVYAGLFFGGKRKDR